MPHVFQQRVNTKDSASEWSIAATPRDLGPLAEDEYDRNRNNLEAKGAFGSFPLFTKIVPVPLKATIDKACGHPHDTDASRTQAAAKSLQTGSLGMHWIC